MKTQTKTEVRNNTAKATKLLRGIDNETAAIAKGTEALNKRTEKVAKDVATVTSLVLGLSNTASAAVNAKPIPAPKPSKPAAKAAGVKTEKPAKKTAAKKTPAKNSTRSAPWPAVTTPTTSTASSTTSR